MHIYDMWSSISRTAGRLVTLRASSAQLGILSDLHDQMIDLSEKDDTIRYHPLNTAFHSSLFEFSGNPRLAQLHTQISKEMRLFSKHGIIGVGSLRVSAHEHAEILQAIKAGDAERAAVAFETHVLHGKQRILDSLLKGRDLV
jgi:DNA-binding GntR family transcriptional regulator